MNSLLMYFTIIGKIEERNLSSPCLDNFGILILINTITCWLLNQEKKKKGIWGEITGFLKIKLPNKWNNNSYLRQK